MNRETEQPETSLWHLRKEFSKRRGGKVLILTRRTLLPYFNLDGVIIHPEAGELERQQIIWNSPGATC